MRKNSNQKLSAKKLEVLRNDSVIGRGKTISLQSDKKDVGKVETGHEAGLGLDFGEPKILVGDTLIFFRKV